MADTPNPATTEWVPLWDLEGGSSGGGGPHAPTHETGGTDPITNLAGEVITSGTVADARLSANVALENTANVFTANQTIQNTDIVKLVIENPTTGLNLKKWTIFSWPYDFIRDLIFSATNDDGTEGLAPLSLKRTGDIAVSRNISMNGTLTGATNVPLTSQVNTWTQKQILSGTTGSYPRIEFINTSATPGYQRFYVQGTGNELMICAGEGEGAADGYLFINRGGTLNFSGQIYEAGRNWPIGYWQDYTPILTPVAGTITGGTIYGSYTLIGKTIIILISFSAMTFTNVSSVNVSVPYPIRSLGGQQGTLIATHLNGIWGNALAYVPSDGSIFQLYGNPSFANSADRYFWGQLIFPLL